MLDAVTPLICIDIWTKFAKNTKIGRPEVIGNVVSGVGFGAIQIRVHLSDILNKAPQ